MSFPNGCRITRSSIRFLESSSGTFTTELLWLTSSGIWNEKSLVVLEKSFFELSLGWFIIVSLVEWDNSLGNGHSNSHTLIHGTTTLNSDSDAKILKSLFTEKKNWFIDLDSHWLWLNELDWLSIHSDKALTSLAESNGSCVLLLSESSNLLLIRLVTHYLMDMMHKLRLY